LVSRLNHLALSHLQVVRAVQNLGGTPVEALQDTIGYYRARYNGMLMANLGFDRESGNALIESGGADLVSFGTPFIGNPDFVHRLRKHLPIAISNRETYYQGGPEGYVDYPIAV
jgi:N-ethylmaleimide reductase